MKRWVLSLLLAYMLCVPGCRISNYSDGFRIGTVIKFSQKGWIWKTYEGEMVLGGLRSGGNGEPTANLWDFSLDAWRTRGEDIDKLAAALTRAAEAGERIKVFYKQDFQLMTGFSRGETDYYVQRVEFVQ